MRVKSGCGCMTVQTGSRVLASLSIISTIIVIITVSVILNSNDVRNNLQSPYADQQITAVIIGCIFGGLISSGFAGLMIYGSVRRDPGWVFPYVALGFSGLVNLVIMSMAFVIVAGLILPVGTFLMMSIFFIAWTVLQIYFWLIMYTHYKDLAAEKYGCQKNPNDGKIFTQPMNAYHNV